MQLRLACNHIRIMVNAAAHNGENLMLTTSYLIKIHGPLNKTAQKKTKTAPLQTTCKKFKTRPHCEGWVVELNYIFT